MRVRFPPPSKAAAAPSYGAELRFAYEMPHARLGVDLGTSGASDSITQLKLALHGSYLYSTGYFSPFVGGGVALLGQYADEDFEDSDDPQGSAGGVAALLNGGVEFFRLHRVRLLGEAELMLPTFRHPSQWLPTGLIKLSLLWYPTGEGDAAQREPEHPSPDTRPEFAQPGSRQAAEAPKAVQLTYTRFYCLPYL